MLELSVIIPVYNTPAEALQRCFDSVATLQDISYEVLLIDDGSQASTGKFCQDYAAQNENFRYFHQQNSGASAARNTGMRNALGQYIAFLDADDTLLGSAIPSSVLGSDYSLVIFDLLLQDGAQQTVWHAVNAPSGPVKQEILLKQLIASKSLNSPCAKLFKLAVIRENELQFDSDFVTGEDWNFICDYVLQIPEAYYCCEPAYWYDRHGSTSLSRIERFPDKMLDNALQMLQRKQTLLQLPGLSSDQQALAGIAAATYLEELFNTAADLLLLDKMTRTRKVFIREKAQYAVSLLHTTSPRKARMKAVVLRRIWFILRPLAYLRKLYLKLKH